MVLREMSGIELFIGLAFAFAVFFFVNWREARNNLEAREAKACLVLTGVFVGAGLIGLFVMYLSQFK